MNEEVLIAGLKTLLIHRIPVYNSVSGRPYIVSNDKLIDAIFLRS